MLQNMKNYFNFNLTGKKLLPIWILFLVLFLVPQGIIVFKMQNIKLDIASQMLFLLLFILLIIIAFLITFYIAKLSIENVSLRDKSIVFDGTFGKYIGTVLLGSFLSIITLGIYGPWFMRNINIFFINNSSYNSNSFRFKGEGGKLFLILLFTLIIPIIIISVIMSFFIISNLGSINSESVNFGQISTMTVINQLVMILIMIPYIYLVYKWMVDVEYKNFNISWKTDFWSSCVKIAIEMILSIITVGIYVPLAYLRLYKYFTEKTFAESDERTIGFGYDIDQLNDFLFIWGQLLLMIITLGIYFPWAFCKIGSRVLGKTYLIEE